MPTQPTSPGSSAPRRRRDAAASRPDRRLPYLFAALAALALGGWWMLSHDDRPPAAYHQLAKLRAAGDFDEARGLVRRLRADWADGSPARDATIDEASARIDRTSDATAALREQVLREAPERNFAQQIDQLKQLSRGEEPATAEAARIVLAELPDLRTDGLARAPRTGAETPNAERVEELEAVTGAAEVAAVLESVAQMADDGEFAQALETLDQALATTDAQHATPLRDRRDSLRAATRAELDRLVATARARAEAGQVDEATALLERHVERFPRQGSLSGLARAAESLRNEARARRQRAAQPAAAEATPSRAPAASLATLTDFMTHVHAAERDGDFAKGAALLTDAADRISDRDPAFAQRLRGQAEDLGYIAALTEMVERGLGAGARPEVTLLDGEVGHISAVIKRRMRVKLDTATRRVGWPELEPGGVCRLVDELKGDADARLGAAVIAFRNEEQALAESRLAQLMRSDASTKQAVFGVLRRHRPGPPDPEGYKLVSGKFVGLREVAAQKLAAKLERQISAALRSPRGKREQLVDELLALGPQALDSLMVALARTQSSLADKLEDHSFRKRVYDKVAARREALDQARAHAIELIYDEDKYFYPYKVPAVSAERAAEYWPVQQEVDARVEAVARIWNQSNPKGRVPSSLRDELDRFQWATQMLRDFGQRNPDVEERTDWVLTLPPVAELNLQNFCKDPEERAAWLLHDRITRFNELQCRDLTAAERRQIEITNEYRQMFGHRPVAVNLKVQDAARGHCQEMSKLGFFGHFSPTPGRRTPFDRMRLAGYSSGASENCAINGSAEGAHVSWLHSSGHHRNLLQPTHKEFGSSNDGRYWTQNFGGGEEYLTHPDFPE